MTPKEKAEELIEKFTMDNTRDGERNGIKCALIAVDEILESHNKLYTGIKPSIYKYWEEVKQEIKNYEKAN